MDGRNLFGCVGAGGTEKCWYPVSAVFPAVSEAGDPRAVKAICYDQTVLVTAVVKYTTYVFVCTCKHMIAHSTIVRRVACEMCSRVNVRKSKCALEQANLHVLTDERIGRSVIR